MTPRTAIISIVGVLVLAGACSGPEPVAMIASERHRVDPEAVSDNLLRAAIITAETVVADSAARAADWGDLGHLYLAHDFDEAAADAYRLAVQRDPASARWHYFLGVALTELDPEQAADALKVASTRDPSSIAARIRAGSALQDSGRGDEARAEFQAALALDSRLAAAHLGLGQIGLEEGKLTDARDHLGRALAIDPSLYEAHVALAQVYLALGDAEAAARHRGAAVGATRHPVWPDPLYEEVLDARVSTYWELREAIEHLNARRFTEALTALDTAVNSGVADAEIWAHRGEALLGLGRDAEAESNLRGSLDAMDPTEEQTPVPPDTRSAVLGNLAVALARQGRSQEAVATFQDALAASRSESAIRNIAVLLAELGRLQEAIAVLDTIPEDELTDQSTNLKRVLTSLRDRSP